LVLILRFSHRPVIRTHPVTGFKSLFVNREYVVFLHVSVWN
jgi:alpha-ketoglutarate-dependent taurine dioxygenase